MPSWDDQANRIFAEAVEITDEDERAHFIESQCGDDTALRDRVSSLIATDARAEHFLDDPAITRTSDSANIADGAEIGPYKLLQQLGEGGFGVVYMAEQKGSLRRHVAVKVIKPGMDSQEVVARFEVERQALALMDHPNVARVFEAGETDGGRPYFVMELVKGIPITEFCDKQQLNNRERLVLLQSVCNAVHHAHQKGVIHRDIKPSNVLVTLHDGKPVPKIIDFGIAKATSQRLTEKTLFTRFGQMVGTPQYMSPEQAEMSGLDVDTRADIYSLGVLLYELLTGTTPIQPESIRAAGWKELMRLIQEQETPKPSLRLATMGKEIFRVAQSHNCDVNVLRGGLRGDLDWIVMKALEKDRNRRYASAVAFAEDVGRYLNDEPVEASPPSTLYRFQKFVRRNRGLAASIAVVSTSLLVGLTVSLYGLQKARSEGARASKAAEKSAGIVSVIQELLYSHTQNGAETVALLDSFTEALPQVLESKGLEESKEVEAEVRFTIGHRYHDLGYVEKARQQLGRSLDLARKTYPQNDIRVAKVLREYSWALADSFTLADSRLYRVKAEQVAREGSAILKANGETSAESDLFLANALMMQNRLDEAEALLERLVESSSDDAARATQLATLSVCHLRRGNLAKAIECSKQTILKFDRGPVAGLAYSTIAASKHEMAEFEEAERYFARTLENAFPPKKSAFWNVNFSIMRANNLLALGQFSEAESLLLESLSACRKDGHVPHELLALRGLGDLYVYMGHDLQAEATLREVVETAESELGAENYETLLAKCRLAKLYVLTGQQALADALMEPSQQLLRQYAKRGGNLPDLITDWIVSLSFCSSTSNEQLREAISLLPDAERIVRIKQYTVFVALANAQARLGNREQAINMLEGICHTQPLADNFDWAICDKLLYEFLKEQGDDDDVEQALQNSVAFREKFTAKSLGTQMAKVRLSDWKLKNNRPAEEDELAAIFETCYSHPQISDRDRELIVNTAIHYFQWSKDGARLTIWKARKRSADTKHE